MSILKCLFGFHNWKYLCGFKWKYCTVCRAAECFDSVQPRREIEFRVTRVHPLRCRIVHITSGTEYRWDGKAWLREINGEWKSITELRTEKLRRASGFRI